MADNLLNRNAIRLLRESWRSPTALAQELYMIVSDERVADRPAEPSPQIQNRIERAAQNAPRQPERPIPIVRQPTASLGDRMRKQGIPAALLPIPPVAAPAMANMGSRSDAEGEGVSLPPATANLVQDAAITAASTTGARARDPVDQRPQAIPAPTPGRPGVTTESVDDRRRRVYQRPIPPLVTQTSNDFPAGYTRGVSYPVGRSDSGTTARQPPIDQTTARQLPARAEPSRAGEYPPDRKGPALPAAAHVAFDVPATSREYGYQPLGLAGAYSGQERLAGDHLPHDYPTIERDPGDPFARKYYDLRFYPTDSDSPRPTAGGGGNQTLLAQVANLDTIPTGGPTTGGTVGQMTVMCNTFSNGLAAGPDSGGPISVIIPQILSTETLPAGMTFLITQASDNNYYGQVPIWLA